MSRRSSRLSHRNERHWSARDRREAAEGFRCVNKACDMLVPVNPAMGTQNRNHCPYCLHSRHVDEVVPGDRGTDCGASMPPVALAFKHLKPDKYGNARVGELMLVHVCPIDGRISPNRIAADDNADAITAVFDQPVDPGLRLQILDAGVHLAESDDRDEVTRQLYGARPDAR
ncbi:MAG: RNHCP domain-containing protein [Acidimicrobiia bacterium]